MDETEIIVGFVVEDRPGIIQKLSEVVTGNGGNWLESSMTTLGGYFSGSVLVALPTDKIMSLTDALEALEEFSITIREPIDQDDDEDRHLMQINVLGPDRPGVVREVTNELAARSINILEMETRVRPAPMTGEPLFEADACIDVPEATDLDELTRQLNAIGDELGVDVLIEDLSQPED